MDRFGSRRLPTPSMAVAVTALVVALGGTSYAVAQLPARSVGSKQLKPKAVAASHIKANAVNSTKVRDGSLTGNDINESSLAQVPLAARAPLADRATSAASADRAGLAGGIDRVVYRVATLTLGQAPAVGTPTKGFTTARCDAGQLVVGGGVKLDENMTVIDSYPDGAAAWTAHADNDDELAAHNFTVYAICITATTAG